ncbi:MAG: sugar phosphate isomerase/epimerase [Lachnospiraceae bacterium]|nr:sugar phosphate isomerase/epimerase [Lachnospiraceae bacterium]
MRLGLSTSLNNNSADEWAKAHAAVGCKSVVFPLDSTAPDSLVAEYVKAAKENDQLIAEVGIWRNAISPDKAEQKKNLEYSINQLALADKIGARCCVNVAGSTGKRWDGAYKENFSKEVWDKTVKMVQTIIDEVKPSNTFFTLEPMPWMVPTGPHEYLRLMDDVERSHFAVHMDIINMINSAERYFFHDDFLEETFELLGSNIKSCHLKDILLLEDFTFQLRECACGEGTFNLEHYVKLANACDPDMPMIIEHLKSNEEYLASIKYVSNRLGNI